MSHGRICDGWDLPALYADYVAGTTHTELAKRLGVMQRVLREEGVIYPLSDCSARDAKRFLREASRELGDRLTVRAYRTLALKSTTPDGTPWPKSEGPLKKALGTQTWSEMLKKVGIPDPR